VTDEKRGHLAVDVFLLKLREDGADLTAGQRRKLARIVAQACRGAVRDERRLVLEELAVMPSAGVAGRVKVRLDADDAAQRGEAATEG
jgi:hypothetical protein